MITADDLGTALPRSLVGVDQRSGIYLESPCWIRCNIGAAHIILNVRRITEQEAADFAQVRTIRLGNDRIEYFA